MKTLKTLALLIAANLLCLHMNAQSTVGQIKGYVIDDDLKPVFAATVKITQSGILIGGTTTDEDGKYSYKPLNPGYYEVTILSTEFPTTRKNNVEVEPEKTAYVDFKLVPNTTGVVIVEAEYVKPIVDVSMYTMHSINADQFLHMPGDRGDLKGAVMNIISDGSQDSNGDLHIRGGRADATEYIVDGIRCQNMNGVPALAVENVSIITGGVPAQYGDLTSGVIVITTKDYFTGIRNKRMRESYYEEKQAKIKREKEAKAMEDKRLKEIEEEKLKEQQSAQPN